MNYYYLVSSLPMINFSQGSAILLTLDNLTKLCQEHLSAKDFAIYNEVDLVTKSESSKSKIFNEFLNWDISLRNAIVGQRVSSQEAAKYRREDKNFYSEVEPIIQEALSKGNAFEREYFIDSVRVKKIDDLTVNHQFDLEFICAYKLKLIFATKYNTIDVAIGEENFQSIVNKIIENKLNINNME